MRRVWAVALRAGVSKNGNAYGPQVMAQIAKDLPGRPVEDWRQAERYGETPRPDDKVPAAGRVESALVVGDAILCQLDLEDGALTDYGRPLDVDWNPGIATNLMGCMEQVGGFRLTKEVVSNGGLALTSEAAAGGRILGRFLPVMWLLAHAWARSPVGHACRWVRDRWREMRGTCVACGSSGPLSVACLACWEDPISKNDDRYLSNEEYEATREGIRRPPRAGDRLACPRFSCPGLVTLNPGQKSIGLRYDEAKREWEQVTDEPCANCEDASRAPAGPWTPSDDTLGWISETVGRQDTNDAGSAADACFDAFQIKLAEVKHPNRQALWRWAFQMGALWNGSREAKSPLNPTPWNFRFSDMIRGSAKAIEEAALDIVSTESSNSRPLVILGPGDSPALKAVGENLGAVSTSEKHSWMDDPLVPVADSEAPADVEPAPLAMEDVEIGDLLEANPARRCLARAIDPISAGKVCEKTSDSYVGGGVTLALGDEEEEWPLDMLRRQAVKPGGWVRTLKDGDKRWLLAEDAKGTHAVRCIGMGFDTDNAAGCVEARGFGGWIPCVPPAGA